MVTGDRVEPPGALMSTRETLSAAVSRGSGLVAPAASISFKPYRAYRDTGVKWLGQIPEHWALRRVSEVTSLVNGFPFDSEHFVQGCEGIPLVRIRDLNAENTEASYVGPVVEDAWIDSGDIIIGMDGDFNVARWRGTRALLNQRLCCLRPRSNADARFIAYVLPGPLKAINDLTYSTTVKHLASGDVRRSLIGVPPVSEQRAIAEFLDGKTTRFDTLIAKKERLIGLLQEKRTALITQAVTEGLDPEVSRKDSGVEWLGEIPEHWDVRPLKAVGQVQTGLTLGKRYDENQRLVSRPYLRVENVQDGYLALDHITEVELPSEQAHRYELRAGDLLMTEGGDYDKLGRGYVWEGQIRGCLHQNHIFAVRPGRDALVSRFLALVVSSGYGRAYFTATSKQSTNLASTNRTKLRNFLLPLPGVLEQKGIIAFVERETAKIDSLIKRIRQATDLLREQRSTLISAAVTGKIDVRNEAA